MYFCYVDESGDCGTYDEEQKSKTGSPYFLLAGLIIEGSKWKTALGLLKSFRKQLARESYLKYDTEFHCAEIIDPHKVKEFTSISVRDRWLLIERFAETIGQYAAFSIITVVIDKRKSKLPSSSYLTEAITRLYRAYDEFLKSKQDQGMLFFDRANEKQINTHVRKLLGTGGNGETISDVRIGWVIEDPIFRISSDSMFIQSSDVIAYTLKESEFPQSSRKKFFADRIFDKKLKSICYKSSLSDNDSIIRA